MESKPVSLRRPATTLPPRDEAQGLLDYLQGSWWLLLIMIACIVIGVYGYVREKTSPETEAAPAQTVPASVLDTKVASVSPPPKRMTDEEKARETINSHMEEFEQDPQSDDAPALLHAAGNLAAQKLGEFEEAISYYEQLIDQYPDWRGIRKVYIQLARCYETVNEQTAAFRTYERMMDVFPEDSQEYLFAKEKIGR
jgi:tetratricopeptide (TPR) repeat protein